MTQVARPKKPDFFELQDRLIKQGAVDAGDTIVEKSLLSCMLTSEKGMHAVLATIGTIGMGEDDPFTKAAHSRIYRAITRLVERGEDVTTIAVGDLLQASDSQYDVQRRIADTDLMDELVLNRVLPHEGESFANKLLSQHRKRKFQFSLQRLSYLSQLNYVSFEELIDQAQQEVFEFANTGTKKGPIELRSAFYTALDEIERSMNSPAGITGIPSGIKSLDFITSGFKRGELTIIGARPSRGKTALGIEVTKGAMKKSPFYLQSIEMSAPEIAKRYLANFGQINLHRLINGRLSDAEYKRLAQQAMKGADIRAFIDDSSEITPLEIRSRARNLVEQHGIELMVVDYLQIIQGGGHFETREREVSYIAQHLKGTARELDIAVVALAQLNRDVEARGGSKPGGQKNARPRNSDLRESGKIEQAADVIILIHHEDDVYDSGEASTVNVELLVTKNRNGPLGDVHTLFHKAYSQFEDAYKPASEQGQLELDPAEIGKAGF